MSADTHAAPSVEGRTGSVDDPTDLTWADYKTALMATKREIKQDDVPSMAAGVAFRIFLAIFPSLLAAVAIFGFFADPAELDTYLAQLQGVVPQDALGIIEGALENITTTEGSAAGAIGIAGILGGLWAASTAAATLVKALNRAYETEESRNFVKQRAVALAITFALLFAIASLVVLVIAGPQIQGLVVPEQLQGPIANIAFGVGQVLLVLAILVVLFAFVYWLGPNRELPAWVWMSPGALVGVVGWLVASLAFTLYVQNFGNYDNATYAGLGSVIVLMLWLQVSMMLVLIGAEFNSEVERLKAQHEAVSSAAGMGHMDELPDVEAGGDAVFGVASATLPALGAAAAGPGVDGGRGEEHAQDERTRHAGGPGSDRRDPASDRRDPVGDGVAAAGERVIRLDDGHVDPLAGAARPYGAVGARNGSTATKGNRAVLAGAAAAAAAIAAVVNVARRGD
jgi:membrane protein